MIKYIVGELVEVGSKSCVVEIGQVGWEVFCVGRLLEALKSKIAKKVKLWTILKIKEEEMILYAFGDKSEIELFLKLTQVSGIGPKSALSIMNLGEMSVVVAAIDNSDTKFIAKAHGVGKKTAQRLIVELKGKLVLDEEDEIDPDVLAALKSLGYSRAEYNDLIAMMPDDMTSTEEKVGWLVKKLGR